MFALVPREPATDRLRRLNIVLLADKKDPGSNEHDYPLWQKRWSLLIGGKQAAMSSETHANLHGTPHADKSADVLAGIPKVELSTAWIWPTDKQFESADHSICLGLGQTIHFMDEAYWPFRGDKDKIKVLATSDETISKGATETKPEPMFWTYKPGKGRVFGCVLGHYTWTFDDPHFRTLLLRGMAWAAGESPYRFDGLILRGAPTVP